MTTTQSMYFVFLWVFFGGMYYSIKVTRFTLNEQIKHGAMLKGKFHELKIWLIAFIQLFAFPLDLLLAILERKGILK